MRLEDLSSENRTLVDEIISSEGVTMVQVSCYTDEGVNDVKTAACDKLLAHRVETKLKGTKINSVINRIHVAQPKARDDVVREPFIPEAAKERQKYDREDPMRRRLEKDIEAEEGGPGVYNINLRRNYILADPSWKDDIMPEIMDGKNIADFIDPDIAEKLEALEREEEKLEAEGFYDSEEEIVDSDEELYAAEEASAKAMKLASERKKMFKNRPVMPRTAGMRTIGEMTQKLGAAGYDTSRIETHAMVAKASNTAMRKRKREERDEAMDVDSERDGEWVDESMEVDGEDVSPKRAKGNTGAVVAKSKLPQSNRQLTGFKNAEQANKAIKLRNLGQRERNMLARAGESDRAIKTKMPKHLFAGKRKGGKTDRR